MAKQNTSTSTSNQTQTTTPWGEAQPYITQLLGQMGAGADAFKNFDWSKLPNGDALVGMANDTLSGKYLDPASNPWLKGSVDAAITPLRQQLYGDIHSIGDAAQQAGAYGGGRQQLFKGQAVTGFNTAATNAATNIYAQNYQQERQRQMMAGQLLAQGSALDTLPLQMQQAGLGGYADILRALTAGYGTTVTNGSQTTPTGGGGMGGALSGALGGASAGAAFGPWGAGIGGVLGGLGGLFG